MQGRKGVGIRTSLAAADALATTEVAAVIINAGAPPGPLAGGRAPVPEGRTLGQGVVQLSAVTRPPLRRVKRFLVFQAAPPLAPREGRAEVGDPPSLPGGAIRPKERKAAGRRRGHVAGAVAPVRAPRGVPAWHEPGAGLEVGALTPGVLVGVSPYVLALALRVIRRPPRAEPLLTEEVIAAVAVRAGGAPQAGLPLLKEVGLGVPLASNAEAREADLVYFRGDNWNA